MKQQLNLFSSSRGDEGLNDSVAPPASKPVTQADLKTARLFRVLADSMQPSIEEKFTSISAEITPTARRLRIKQQMELDHKNLIAIQTGLRAISTALEAGKLPLILCRVNTRAAVEQIYYGVLHPLSRLKSVGITEDNLPLARESLLQLIADASTETDPEKEKLLELRRLEQWIALANIPGYFPTPPQLVKRMIELAQLQPGMTVLEPSAGAGHIAGAILQHDCQVDCVEINSDLCTLLRLKGFLPHEQDFQDFTGNYERIVMNPDFTNCKDAKHILHAYTNCLAPNGILVSIASESLFFRNTKTEKQFREWLFSLGGRANIYKNPSDSFRKSDRPLSIATRLVVIHK